MSVSAPPLALRRDVSRAFVDVLVYPHECPSPAAGACAEVVRAASEDALVLLETFVSVVDETALGALQEEYTRTFDLDTMSRSEPTCHLHVGHYLFDETHKRGAFILGLRKRFRAAGFEDSSDLADHLLVLLRFLAVCEDETLSDELVDDAILPALVRMALLAGSADEAQPSVRSAYFGVLKALELSLRSGRPEPDAPALELETEREWLRDRDSLGIDRNSCGH